MPGHLLLLPVFGLMGNNCIFDFIFFTNARYASSASICVGYVSLRFIHIFKYLSEPLSLSAAYHSFVEVFFRLRVRERPARPVTLDACSR